MALAAISCYRSFKIVSPIALPLSIAVAFLSIIDNSNHVYKQALQGVSIAVILLYSLVKLGQRHPAAKWNILALLFMGGALAARSNLPAEYQKIIHPINLFHYIYSFGVLSFALAARNTTGTPNNKNKQKRH